MVRITKPKQPCIECGRITQRIHGILDVHLCADCQRDNSNRYGCVTKTRAMQEYRLTEADRMELRVIETDNPHYRSAAPMQRYLLKQVREVSKSKYGRDEQYIVTWVPL